MCWFVLGQPFDDVKQRDTPTGLPREIQREAEGLQGRRREVDRSENPLERHHVCTRGFSVRRYRKDRTRRFMQHGLGD